MEYSEVLKLAKQLDKIITSERKEVKDAFRELLIVSALIEGDNVAGPLEKLIDSVDVLSSEVRRLRDEVHRQEQLARRRYDHHYTNDYDQDIHRSRIWGGIRPDDTKNPFKALYEELHLGKFKKDKEE